MKINEILLESSKAPHGVIFKSSKVAYVGQAHGHSVQLDKEVKEKIIDIINNYGAWYEGVGSDREFVKDLTTKWKGSWDDKANNEIKNYPSYFIFVLFSNTKENDQKNILPGKGTIFDRIIQTQRSWGYFKDGRKFNDEDLIKFLKSCSEPDIDFLELSTKEASTKNVNEFITLGEKQMFPKNWDQYPTPSSKVAKQANDYRNKWLLKQKKGVYFMGSGHIKEIGELSNLKIIGGQKI